MRKRTLHLKKKLVSIIFLLLIGGIIFNSTFFLHSHRIASGKVVVHAHPFSKNTEGSNPLAQHQHNKIDLDQLNSIDYFTFLQGFIDIDFKSDFELEILCKSDTSSTSKVYILHTTRGPPYESTLA
jgi:hypothetical protein